MRAPKAITENEKTIPEALRAEKDQVSRVAYAMTDEKEANRLIDAINAKWIAAGGHVMACLVKWADYPFIRK
jgi:DNA-binding IclR family transcriptional regulator